MNNTEIFEYYKRHVLFCIDNYHLSLKDKVFLLDTVNEYKNLLTTDRPHYSMLNRHLLTNSGKNTMFILGDILTSVRKRYGF